MHFSTVLSLHATYYASTVLGNILVHHLSNFRALFELSSSVSLVFS